MGWPPIRQNTGVEVTYTAGYDEGEAPQQFTHAMLVLIEGMHANRGSIPDETKRTAEWICDQYRPAL